jgi:hypothetical protein
VGGRINDDLHTELAEGKHPRHLRKIGCLVDGNHKKCSPLCSPRCIPLNRRICCFFQENRRIVSNWRSIPPSPPPIFSSEKVLQNQTFLEPPDFGGGAPRCSTAASPSCHLSIRLASPKGSLAAPLSRRFPPARAMGQECATPKVLRSFFVKHPCAGLSTAEIEAFDTLASGGEPLDSGDAISGLVRLRYLDATGWTLDHSNDRKMTTQRSIVSSSPSLPRWWRRGRAERPSRKLIVDDLADDKARL